MVSRRSRLVAVFPLIWLMAVSSAVAGPDRPHVLLIVADSQGHGEAGFRGNPRIDTPHLDRLAASGIKLDQFHISPDRATSLASLLTGRYHYRAGVSSDSPGEGVMHGHEITLGEVFRHAGYATGFFGSWQNGNNWPQNAPGQGFDRSSGDPIAWLDEQAAADRPFFCVLMLGIDPPVPALVKKYRERDGIDARTAADYARIETADTEAGRAIAWLDARRLRERTVVWYLAARGTSARKDDPRPRYNAHLRGGEDSVHEGGVRVPSVLSWPGKIPPGASFGRLTAHIDALPTLVDLCGIEPPELPWIDGMSLRLALTTGGQPERWPNRLIFTSWTPPGFDTANASVSVRTDRWAALRDPLWRQGKISEAHSGWELYDLDADPHERTDLSEDYPYLLSDMRADFSRWMDETTDDGLGLIPTELGHPEWPEVVLRDALRWPVKVKGDGGRYRVTVLAAAPRRRMMRLTFGEKTLDFEMGEGRAEAGEIEFPPGAGELILRPAEPGGPAIQLREITLSRVTK